MLLCPGPRQRSACVCCFCFSAQFPLLLAVKQLKRESAETEKAWQGAGEKVGVQIWRIVKFKVRAERYYKISISLNTFKLYLNQSFVEFKITTSFFDEFRKFNRLNFAHDIFEVILARTVVEEQTGKKNINGMRVDRHIHYCTQYIIASGTLQTVLSIWA